MRRAATFTALAGHRYLAYVDFVAARGAADEAGAGYVWIGRVRDEGDGGKGQRSRRAALGVVPAVFISRGHGFRLTGTWLGRRV